MNTNSAFTGSITEKPFWYQHFDLRQIRILRRGQPLVDYETSDNCCLYVTALKAMNFQNYMLSIPVDKLRENDLLVFDLTSMQDAIEDCHYPEFVGEPLRLQFKFTYALSTLQKLLH